jgi:hypothetical protein
MFKRIKDLKNLIGNTFGATRLSGEFLLRETDFGTIHVETDVIRRIIERTRLEGVHEINNIIIDAPTVNLPLQIKLDLVILQNYSAPILGAKLRDAIKEELKNILDIRNALFDIRVTKINQNLPEIKKRRVR